jgi:orotidine-5'-phosphate decarboxylase
MKQAKDYIIFPLDVPSLKKARQYIKLLSEYVGMFKVGLELFIRSGPEITRLIKESGKANIFLDLKLHDIPETVSRAMERIADLGVTFATVHCGEANAMLKAAVQGSRGRVGVLGVTVLTSVSSENIQAAGFREKFSSDIARLVMKRAVMAKEAGCTGVVCSGHEVRMIKENLGKDFTAVTPGIRPSWDNIAEDDQQRITTPVKAINNGSDYLVIGRPIRDAKDPKAAAIRIAEEIETVLSEKIKSPVYNDT